MLSAGEPRARQRLAADRSGRSRGRLVDPPAGRAAPPARLPDRQARATSANCLARCSWDRQSVPVARCASGTSTCVTRMPLRSRSMVSAVSTPKPGASGQGRLERRPGQAALAVQRLVRPPAGRALDARPGQCDDEAMAALAHPVAEHRDRHVGRTVADRIGQRPGLRRALGQVAIEEEQMARYSPGVWTAQAAGLPRRPSPWRPPCPGCGHGDHRGLPRARRRRRPVGRAVVDDDDDVHPGQPGGGSHCRADPVGLVPGRDDDGDVAAWRHGVRS